jgi:hypothetical protein
VAGVRVVTGRGPFLLDQPREKKREIVRLHPHACRRAAQHHAAVGFAHIRRRFRRDQDQEPVERHASELGCAVADFAKFDDRTQLRRDRPRHQHCVFAE